MAEQIYSQTEKNPLVKFREKQLQQKQGKLYQRISSTGSIQNLAISSFIYSNNASLIYFSLYVTSVLFHR